MEALSQIEDRVDLIVRMTSIAKADDDEGQPAQGEPDMNNSCVVRV